MTRTFSDGYPKVLPACNFLSQYYFYNIFLQKYCRFSLQTLTKFEAAKTGSGIGFLRLTAVCGGPNQAESHKHIGKGNPWLDFLMVIMGSGIARGRVRTTTTTTTESRKMAAIHQTVGWQRHAALVYRVLLWYRTSVLWSIDTCQNKVSADQYHMTISRAPVYGALRSSVFSSRLLIGSRAHVRFTS